MTPLVIPFIDLKSQYQDHKTALDTAAQSVLNHGHYIMEPEVAELEEKLSSYIDTKHVLSLPMHPYLEADTIDFICDAVLDSIV